MAHAYYHSLSSAKKFGGGWEEYLPIHEWFDASKELLGDFRHRALRHHTQGVFECERVFGKILVNSSGKNVPVRAIAEQHVMEDLGRLPSAADWLMCIKPENWMAREAKKLSEEYDLPTSN